MSGGGDTGAQEIRKKKRKKKHKRPKRTKRVAEGNVPDDDVSLTDESPPPPPSGIQRVAVKQAPPVKSHAANASSSARSILTTSPQMAVAPDDIPKGIYGHLLSTRRVETLCQSLGLARSDVTKMQRVFACEDLHRDGEITPDEFFSIIREEKRALTAGIFEYAGLAAKPRRLSFDDFVLCVATFATFSREELMMYAFTLFDKDDSGAMDASELSAFCGDLKNRQFFFASNVETAKKKLADRETKRPGAIRDGLVDLEDITKGSSQFQAAFYPILQMQRNIRVATLGEFFWEAIVLRKQQIEVVVHYMRLHKGQLPPLSIQQRLRSLLHPNIYLIRRAAVLKHAQEIRQHKEQEELERQSKELNGRQHKEELPASSGDQAALTAA